MLCVFSPYARRLRRALADERRTTRALRETCADLRAYQERILSDNRYLYRQNMDLQRENTRALDIISDIKAEVYKMRAKRARDESGRFV